MHHFHPRGSYLFLQIPNLECKATMSANELMAINILGLLPVTVLSVSHGFIDSLQPVLSQINIV